MFVTWGRTIGETLVTDSKAAEQGKGRQAWEKGTVTTYGRLAPSRSVRPSRAMHDGLGTELGPLAWPESDGQAVGVKR